jgi:hypothetical protein
VGLLVISTVKAPMEVSRVTSGVPPSALAHMTLGTARWEEGEARWEAAEKGAVPERHRKYRGLSRYSPFTEE